MRNIFHEWIDELPPGSILFIVDELWGPNEFNENNIDYLRTCFKKSRRVYEYFLHFVLIGD